MDILSTSGGRTQPVRTKSLQKADILATFERQMAEYMQAAGERIRAAREAKFRTRAKAQDETGIQEKQWYRLEHGLTDPTPDNWERIAEVLEVDLATLRADPPKMLDPESAYQAQLDRIEQKLDELLERIKQPAEAPRLPQKRPTPPPRKSKSEDTRAPRKRRAA